MQTKSGISRSMQVRVENVHLPWMSKSLFAGQPLGWIGVHQTGNKVFSLGRHVVPERGFELVLPQLRGPQQFFIVLKVHWWVSNQSAKKRITGK